MSKIDNRLCALLIEMGFKRDTALELTIQLIIQAEDLKKLDLPTPTFKELVQGEFTEEMQREADHG